jgi:hypothetical protein
MLTPYVKEIRRGEDGGAVQRAPSGTQASSKPETVSRGNGSRRDAARPGGALAPAAAGDARQR